MTNAYKNPSLPGLLRVLLLTLLLVVPVISVTASPLLDGQGQSNKMGDAKDNSQTPVATQPVSSQSTPDTSQNNTATGNTTTNTGNANPRKSVSTTPQNFIPMTPGEKFKYFTKSSFFSLAPYGYSVLSGVFSEATDNDHHRHMTAGDFLADSMTHAARSYAFRVTANFFEKFAYASLFKQDPRYFRSQKHGFSRITYAVSRVVITQGDNGNNQFNISFMAGGLTAAGISNAWARPEDRTLSSTMSRFGYHIAYRALSNILKEMFGKQ